MSGRKLDESYLSLQAQLGAHEYARMVALRKTVTAELLAQLGLADLVGSVAKSRRKAILERFESTGRQIRRQGFVDLVSAFETDLFRLLRMATSKSRHVLNRHYDPAYPFALHRQELARTADDFSNLGGYRRLLATNAASRTDPRQDVWDVVAHRDFLAHGERWQGLAVPPTIDSAHKILTEELNRAEAKPL